MDNAYTQKILSGISGTRGGRGVYPSEILRGVGGWWGGQGGGEGAIYLPPASSAPAVIEPKSSFPSCGMLCIYIDDIYTRASVRGMRLKGKSGDLLFLVM